MRKYCILVAAFLGIAGTASAAEFQPLGTLGMGGAGVARQMGALTAYWNPAAGAFNDKTFSFATGAEFGLRGSNGLTENVDRLSDIDFNSLSNFQTDNGTPANAATVGNTVRLITILDDINKRNGYLAMTASAPVGFAIKHFSFGVFGNMEGYVQALPDTDNILPTSPANGTTTVSATDIFNAIPANTSTTPSLTYFNADQFAAIKAVFTNQGLTDTQATQVVNVIGSELQSSGIPASTVTGASTGALNTALTSDGTATLDRNNTSVMTKALLYAEVPFAYGHPFDLGRFGKIGVGAAVKIISGTVYQNQVLLVNRPDGGNIKSGDLIKEITKNKQTTTNFGLDLGAMWKYEKVTVGIVAKNLNAPTFDAPTFQRPRKGAPNILDNVKDGDIKLDPQARMGVAYEPFGWLTIAADLDLTENDAVVPSAAVKSRNLGGGIEMHPWWWLKFRLGAYKNLAQSDSSPVATLGLSLGPIDLDLAAATDTFKVGSATVPQEVKAQLMGGFSF